MRIIGGKFKGKTIASPPHEGTRPTSDRTREMIFNVLLHNPSFGAEIIRDKAALDVFAGTGALGLEAYSRGANPVQFIENNPETLSILKKNAQACGLSLSTILAIDAQKLRNAPHSFDLIFLDPPYHKNLILPTLTTLILQGWISEDAVIIIEIAKNEPFSPPPFLKVITERTSGAAKVLFCFYHKE